MNRSHEAMRGAIIGQLFEHLNTEYGLEGPTATPSTDQVSNHDLDAILAFRSDRTLDELRNALLRLENGTYGTCIVCKQQMTQDLLDHDPTQRVCPGCAKKLNRRPLNTASLLSVHP